MPFDGADIGVCTVTYTMPSNVIANAVYTAAYNGTSQRSDEDSLDDWEGYLDDLYTVVSADMSNLVTIDGFELSRVIPGTNPIELQFIGVGPVAPQPPNALDMVAHGVALQYNARLNGQGRGSAKKFHPGFTEPAITNGIWDPAVVAAQQVGAQIWADRFGGGDDWIPGTFSIGRGFRSLRMPTVRSIASYQTRRKPGVGS